MVEEHAGGGGGGRGGCVRGAEGRDEIKYTLSVKSMLFWDFSMQFYSRIVCCSLELRRQREDGG